MSECGCYGARETGNDDQDGGDEGEVRTNSAGGMSVDEPGISFPMICFDTLQPNGSRRFTKQAER